MILGTPVFGNTQICTIFLGGSFSECFRVAEGGSKKYSSKFKPKKLHLFRGNISAQWNPWKYWTISWGFKATTLYSKQSAQGPTL